MRFLLTIIFALVHVRCGETEFNASGGIAPKKDAPAQKNEAPANPDRPAAPKQNKTELCEGEGYVNLILVFDNSGSQSREDLASMRQGAYGLVDSLQQCANKGNLDVMIASVSFNRSATISTNQWTKATDTSTVKADIDQATNHRSGNTYYGSALERVTALFNNIGASRGDKSQRNFVVFLSDGEPDDGAVVMTAGQRIVDDYSASFVTIGTGGTDFAFLKLMANLTSSDHPADHSGMFFLAQEQAQVGSVFAELGDRLGRLCD